MKLLQLSTAVLLSLYLAACSTEPSGTHTHEDGSTHANSDHDNDDHGHDEEGHGHDHDGHDHDGDDPLAAVMPSENAAVHALKCGCAIDSVGKCGEYIEVDGSFVALDLPVDLGSMPFCHKKGLKAAVDGEMKDGTFIASTFAYRE